MLGVATEGVKRIIPMMLKTVSHSSDNQRPLTTVLKPDMPMAAPSPIIRLAGAVSSADRGLAAGPPGPRDPGHVAARPVE